MANPESFLFLPQGDESSDAVKSITPTCVASIWGDQDLTFDSASSGSGFTELDTCSEVTADDDYIAELAQQMAEYMIEGDDKHPKTWGLSSSPQSTLWSPFGSKQWGPKQSQPVVEDSGSTIHHEKQRLVGGVPEREYPQLQVATKGNNKKIRQQKRMEIQDSQNKETPKPNPWSNTNPGAGMRAVFLGGSSGTGVFLPRGGHSNNPSQSQSQSHKKIGCSRVVIPARVAQALKLHFDHVGLVSKPKSIIHSSGALQLDTSKNENENDGSAANQQLEVALPQEWTY